MHFLNLHVKPQCIMLIPAGIFEGWFSLAVPGSVQIYHMRALQCFLCCLLLWGAYKDNIIRQVPYRYVCGAYCNGFLILYCPVECPLSPSMVSFSSHIDYGTESSLLLL